MDLGVLKKQIKDGKFDNFYVWTGTEVAIRDTYLKMISDKSGKKIQSADSIIDVYAKAKAKSLINESKIYFIREDKEFTTLEKAWNRLAIKDDIVILYYSHLDKRTKFYKRFESRLVSFDRMEDRHLITHIRSVIDLSEDNCKKLIDACDGDWSRIQLEIDKIQQYVNYLGPAKTQDGVFDKLLKEGVIYRQPKDSIFDFVDAVLRRDSVLAYDLLEQSYAVGEANMVLLSVLYNNIRALLQVQTCKEEKKADIGKTTGLNGWQIKNVSDKCGNYRLGELVRALKIIRKCEKGIKTGRMEDRDSVYYVLANIL